MQIQDTRRWEDLPAAFVAHILQLVPYKRADVKLVCRDWRAAVNASLKTVTMPAEDLHLLAQCPAVQTLILRSSESAGAQSASGEDLTTAVANLPLSSQASTGNPWSLLAVSTLQRLKVLQLHKCPDVFRQLASWQAAQTVNDTSRPVLADLQQLQVTGAGNIAELLPLVIAGTMHGCSTTQHIGSEAGSEACSSSNSRGLQPWPLESLGSLLINNCTFSQDAAELSVLLQLTALHTLELSSCALLELPSAVCGCVHLTRLDISCNLLVALPQEVSGLTHLEVLALSSSPRLHSLGPGFSCLSALTQLNLSGPNSLFLRAPMKPAQARMVFAAPTPTPAECQQETANLFMPNPVLTHQQQLEVLPELRSCTALVKLSLASNRDMRVLPASLSVLTALEVLDVGGCGLNFIDEQLWGCAGLRELHLQDTVVSSLPDDISKLQKLQVLDLGSCGSLWRLPASLLDLSALTRLVLTSKAVGQDIVERLELRSLNPVEVEFAGDDDWDDHRGDYLYDDYYTMEEYEFA